MRIGYARVSTDDQTLDLQKDTPQGLRMKGSCQDLSHVVVVPACVFASSSQAVL